MAESNLSFKREGKKFGFVDEEGKWVIEPIFDDAYEFIDEDEDGDIKYTQMCAAVEIDGKRGYINEKGEYLLQPGQPMKFLKADNGLYGMGYKDPKTGEDVMIMAPQFTEVLDWGDYLIGRTDKDVVVIFEPDGEQLTNFYEASFEDEGYRIIIWQDGEEWRFYPDGKCCMAFEEDDEENWDDDEDEDEEWDEEEEEEDEEYDDEDEEEELDEEEEDEE